MSIPSAAGQGVASMLCDALEKLAGGRGAKSLTVDASDNAQEFFAKRGYVAKQRNTVTVNGEWLANTTMQKTLADSARRELRHEPRTPLSVRHHAARRRADQRRRFHAA